MPLSPSRRSVTDSWSSRPLNSVGLPYYREVLASAWPDMVSDVGAPPVRFEPQFLAGLKPTEFGSYGRNTRGLRRNQAEDTRNSHKAEIAGLKAPKFLSEKAREVAISDSRGSDDKADDVSSHMGDHEVESKHSEVPVTYRNVEIKYSKFGVDDFDFGYYNKTRYSGLETHISNSYANPLLQIMHFTPLIRNLALQHAATACLSETCLLCELGFLFDMLQKADGSICQATNLLKALSSHPQGTLYVEPFFFLDLGLCGGGGGGGGESFHQQRVVTNSLKAGPLGLLEEDPHGSSLNVMLQGLTRFFMDRIATDFESMSPESPAMEQVRKDRLIKYLTELIVFA